MSHPDSVISQSSAAGSFNPYLDGMSGYPGQYGPAAALYPHHFSKLRGTGSVHDLAGAGYGQLDYPAKPQQAVPTYKWMQVKRNVPKPGQFFLNIPEKNSVLHM